MRHAVDESHALIEKSVRRAVIEADTEKRAAYTIVLVNALSDSTTSYDDKIDALDALDSLTRRDIRTLRYFESGHPIRVADLVPNMVNPMADPAELTPRVAPFAQSLSKLEARGLIAETKMASGGFSYTGDINHWVNRWRQRSFEILPFGRLLLNYLRG